MTSPDWVWLQAPKDARGVLKRLAALFRYNRVGVLDISDMDTNAIPKLGIFADKALSPALVVSTADLGLAGIWLRLRGGAEYCSSGNVEQGSHCTPIVQPRNKRIALRSSSEITLMRTMCRKQF